MKLEFESVLFGLAFLILVLISLPEQEEARKAPLETASASQIEIVEAAPLQR